MSKVKFGSLTIDCLDSESVLDALLRNEAEIPYSCKTGVCQTCLMRAINGAVPEDAQKGLKDTLVAQNYFLACSCHPKQDLEIRLPADADVFSRAVIRNKFLLSTDVLQLELEPSISMYYHAGQFINLRRQDGLIRSYSIASLPQSDKYVELHIKRMKNGKMSNWLFDEAVSGEVLDIQGPIGNCFYVSGKHEQNLLLIGTGTGLAPLFGIVKDALHTGHQGNIYLYHGVRRIDGLYQHEQLCALETEFDNFFYKPCLTGDKLNSLGNHEVLNGRANELALKNHTKLANWCIYVCGVPEMVNKTKKMAFLAGANLADIYADPFELTELRKQPR